MYHKLQVDECAKRLTGDLAPRHRALAGRSHRNRVTVDTNPSPKDFLSVYGCSLAQEKPTSQCAHTIQLPLRLQQCSGRANANLVQFLLTPFERKVF